MSPMIPYESLKILNQSFEKELSAKFQHFLNKGWYILGEELALFEDEYAAYHHERYAVGVANGLDALILSLRCCNFKSGDEVIVPANTYIATILAIIQCGLTPVLVEPDPNTYNIDPARIKAAITQQTVAIIVVHLYGQCCDMDTILALTQNHGLKLIEDCAQSHGAKYKGRLAGTFGDFGAFSFYPTKNLGALGDAGAIICKTEEDNHKLRQLRNYGSEKKYHNGVIGYNSRLDELQAAFLRIKLPHLNAINSHKRKLASLYFETLDEQFTLPVLHSDFYNVYHIFNILHPQRDQLKQFLADNGIQTEIHYPVAPQHQLALRNHLQHFDYPISAHIHAHTLSLPCSFAHTEEQIKHVAQVMNEFIG